METKVKFNEIHDYLTILLKRNSYSDPLPAPVPKHEITDSEIDGQIINIVHQYLSDRECSPYIRNLVAHKVWSQVRSCDHDDQENDLPLYNSRKYEPFPLMKDITKRANGVVEDLHQNLTMEQAEAVPSYLPVSRYSIKNTRRKMEDKHTILQDLNTLYGMKFGHPHAFYGVFDGHAGVDAAVYASLYLHQYMIQNPLYEIQPIEALKHAFHITDTNFIKKASSEKLNGGTTAVVALIREKKLVVAWLGDSQALLVQRRKPVQVVTPHTPNDLKERNRIEKEGGYVSDFDGTWRVLGHLAVSRAIGDANFKPFISTECDIKSMEITGDEDFLILGCDGLWDGIDGQAAVNLVYSYLKQNDGDTDGVGRCLVQAAKNAGSEDNITAVVVFLRPVSVLMEEEDIRIAHGEVTEADQVTIAPVSKEPVFVSELFPSQSPQHKEYNLEDGLPENAMVEEAPLSEPKYDPSSPTRPESDSDEGVRPKSRESTDSAKHNNDPTEAQVDAALAELDSLPGEESSEDDAEWVYTKPIENELKNESVEVNSPPAVSASMNLEEIPAPAPLEISIDSSLKSIESDKTPSPVSPQRASPRSVEGFVTSVELNTPEEAFNTNLTINQSTDFFAEGTSVEQSSGPFSVYVSSSPEPSGMETSPVQLQASIEPPKEDFNSNAIMSPAEQGEVKSNDVEIIHAQSLVEVTPTSVVSSDFQPMPDIMTQSFTGDQLPEQPYNPEEVVASMTESMTELSMDTGHEVSRQLQFNGQLENQLEEPEQPSILDLEPAIESSNFISNESHETLLATQPMEPISNISEKEVIMNEANILADVPKVLPESIQQPEVINEQPLIEPEITPIPDKIVEETPQDTKLPEEVVEMIPEKVIEPVMEKPVEEPQIVPENSAPEPIPEKKEAESEYVTPTNTPKAPPKPAARTTSLKTSSRTPVSRLSKGTTQPTSKPAVKTLTKPSPKVEDKKPTVPKARDSVKPTSRVAAAKPSPKTTTSTRPIASKTSSTTTTSRLTSRKPTTTTAPTKTASPASKPATSAPKRVPLSARTTATSKPTLSATSTKSATTTNTTTTRRPMSAPRPTATSLARTMPATKDTKNTTNKLISSRPSSGLPSKAPSAAPTRTRTTTTTKTSTTTTRRPITNAKTNMTGIKSKIDTGRTTKPVKSMKQEPVTEKTSEVNGENKIVEEETSIEVKEKLIEEKQTLAESNQEVLLNGNH